MSKAGCAAGWNGWSLPVPPGWPECREIQLGLTGGEAGQGLKQIGATDEVGSRVTPSWAISSRVSSAMNLK
ncbi:hypothetical protein ACNKHX_19770 [Shigella flexneri]